MNQNTSKRNRSEGRRQKKPQPYIFVSYSHKDKPEVRKIIARLKSDGYSLWYDEMIPSEHWSGCTEEKLVECQVFLLFMTNNYKASTPCKSELDLAHSQSKPIIPVFLEAVKLEIRSGYMLKLASSMHIMAYEFKWWEDFYSKLVENEHIQRCKIKGKPTSNSEKAGRNRVGYTNNLDELVEQKNFLMDYSALISPGGGAFFKKSIPLLERHQKQLNIPKSALLVLDERRRLRGPDSSICEHRLQQITELNQRGFTLLFEQFDSSCKATEATVRKDLEELAKCHREKSDILVITQNDSLAKRLMDLNHSKGRNDKWITLKRIGESGDLEDPHFIKNSAKSRS